MARYLGKIKLDTYAPTVVVYLHNLSDLHRRGVLSRRGAQGGFTSAYPGYLTVPTQMACIFDCPQDAYTSASRPSRDSIDIGEYWIHQRWIRAIRVVR